MNIYADTGFIVSLYTQDANSAAAAALMQRQPHPAAWTRLHAAEFRNAIRLRHFRKEITRLDVAAVLQTQDADLAAGIFSAEEPPWMKAWEEFERLSAAHTSILGTRSLDILHVAQAVALGVKDFLTFDKRQAALAKAAGLRLMKL